jgi:hypothetical protein
MHHSLIMLMRYLYLAILATTAATACSQSAPESPGSDMARQLAGNFDWEIEPEDGYPIIAFDDSNEQSEVIFKYNFTGTLSDTKFLDVNLYQNDCGSASDASFAIVDSINGDELDIMLNIIQETISDSIHYQDVNGTAAAIGFCLRVDYNFVDDDGLTESINFYETNVTITVDLTANFTLTGITADRTAADIENADAFLDYPVEAYICLDDNSEVSNPEPLVQGSALQVCIRIGDNVTTQNVLVEDIITFVISQPDGTATDTLAITNTVPGTLTDKVCRESGICNVKSQLQSKFFTDSNPGDLRVDGVAVLAFGKASLMPSSAPGVRRLRAPIRGLLTGDDVKAFMAAQKKENNNNNNDSDESVVSDWSQRLLQNGAAETEFGLGVGLQGINGVSNGQDDSSGGVGSALVVATVVFVLLAIGCGLGFYLRSPKEQIAVEKHNHNIGCDGSVGTHPTQPSVHTTSPDQGLTHRGGANHLQDEYD